MRAHDLRLASRRLALRSGAGLAGAVLAATLAPGLVAEAQSPPPTTSIPGLVVTMPPAPAPGPASAPPPAPMAIPGLVVTPPPGAPPAAAPPAAAPVIKATPVKPKPRPAPVVSAPVSHGIVLLVNDEPITAFEIDQRARFLALGANITDAAKAYLQRVGQLESTTARLKAILEEVIKANPGKTREQIIAIFEERKKQFVLELQKQAVASARAGVIPTKRKEAENEIIEERLKLQEAKRLGIVVGEEDVDRVLKSVAEKNNVTVAKFAENIKSMGADISVMRSRFRATIAWREVIRRRFGPQIAISNKEIDAFVAGAGPAGADSVDLHVHRIILPAAAADQTALAQRYAEAERIRKAFAGCKSTATLVKGATGARFEDLGFKPTSAIPAKEETRSFLLAARDGEMVPPLITTIGVELFAVCARRVQKASDAKREKAQEELMMREFDAYSKRHIRFLMTEARIERPPAAKATPPPSPAPAPEASAAPGKS